MTSSWFGSRKVKEENESNDTVWPPRSIVRLDSLMHVGIATEKTDSEKTTTTTKKK